MGTETKIISVSILPAYDEKLILGAALIQIQCLSCHELSYALENITFWKRCEFLAG